jgi:hypothetical protein
MAKWVDKLQQRWKLQSAWQVIFILIVFACTGTTVLLIKRPLFAYWFPDGDKPLWASVIYFVLVFPIYNIFLLAYGFVFGQFRFFWDFEKRFLNRIFSKFSKPKG